MALIPSQVLRVAILLSYLSTLCSYRALDIPAHQTYGGSWKFLTFINLVIQTVFFGISVLTDLSSLLTQGSDDLEQQRQLRKLISLRDWLMAVLAFPVGVHTTVLPFILIEMRTTHHHYPNRTTGQAAVSFFSTGYILWICWVHHVTGMWVYPLLDHLPSFPKLFVFVSSVGVINVLYLMGETLNGYIWDKSRYIEEKLKDKNKVD
ncbi:androgen-induced gene 1 protein isoform X2 [Mobula hypostoma]|uniref:androgen-induced gene 1 protein isoform X2 n=1 Tax=Mobula hypostoma TaxID=723540 RepID=UPI002FC3961C